MKKRLFLSLLDLSTDEILLLRNPGSRDLTASAENAADGNATTAGWQFVTLDGHCKRVVSRAETAA